MKKPDVMDLVILAGADAVKAADELGWSFLAEYGYDVQGWDSEDEETARAAHDRVAGTMKERGESLVYHGAVDDASPRFVFWYSLRCGRRELAKSRVLQFVQRKADEEGETT